MVILPTLNPDDSLEYSWAKWLIDTQKDYRQGKLNKEQRNLFENLAKKYNIELRPPSYDTFAEQCQAFCDYVEKAETK